MEILIVVVILGILASIVIPQFTNATTSSQDSAVQMNLHRIRSRIEVYREEHNGKWPTYANFVAQMTQATNAAGETAPVNTEGYPFGPYLAYIPRNPFEDSNTISDEAVVDGGEPSAWYYDEQTGAFHANDSERTFEF